MDKREVAPHAPPWYAYPAMLMRRIYAWVLHWSATPYNVPALFVIAFAESSFFPVPPDVLLMAMALSMLRQAFFYALICSVGSVCGGLFGYGIGYFLWEKLHAFFIPHIFSQVLFDAVRLKYEMYSFWVVFLAAFTPIPYKIFTIAAGVCGISLPGFLLASVVGRSLRFFMVAGLLYCFGEKMKRFIERYFEWLTLAFAALIVVGFLLVKKMI
ncbi:MAG: DedA family protein [Candidatus Omnitrophica bacterium]|nr:DedA family protein [Candidatus Omnitrophota bacterium]